MKTSIMNFFKREAANTPQVVGAEEPSISGKKIVNDNVILVDKRMENHELCDRIQSPRGHSPLVKDAEAQLDRSEVGGDQQVVSLDNRVDNAEDVVEIPLADTPIAQEIVVEETVTEAPIAQETVVEETVVEEIVAETPIAPETAAEEAVEAKSSRPSRKKKVVDPDAAVKTPRTRAPRGANAKKKADKDNKGDENINENTAASVDTPQSNDPVVDTSMEISNVAVDIANNAEVASAKPKRKREKKVSTDFITTPSIITESVSYFQQFEDFNAEAYLDPDYSVKYKYYVDRAKDLLQEMLELESAESDTDMDITGAVDLLNDAVNNSFAPVTATPSIPAASYVEPLAEGTNTAVAPSTPSKMESKTDVTSPVAASPVAPVVVRSPVEMIELAVRRVIARLVQGKSSVFSEVEPVVRQQLVSLQAKFKEELNDLNRAVASGRCDSSINIEYTSQGLNTVCTELSNILSTPHVLNERIKVLAERKSYGSKNKTVLLSEDKDETGQAIYRWEIVSMNDYYNKQQQATIKECRLTRNRYGRLITACHRILDCLIKVPLDCVKFVLLVEKYEKSNIENEKAKEKRRELERKKVVDMAAREQREREKMIKDEEKRRLQEEKKKEQDEKKREQDEKKKEQDEKKRLKEEEEKKKTAVMEKSSNMFKSFFKAPSATSTATAKVCGSPAAAVTKSMDSVRKASQSAIVFEDGIDPMQVYYDLRAKSLTLEDIQKSFLQTKQNSEQRRGRCIRKVRKPKILTVAISKNSNAFSEGFSENKQVKVDSRMKLFKFVEDIRPPYYGTKSKRSNIVTGRRPFAKDHKLNNYEYDSEEDWSEGDGEGENIEDSANEEEDEDDELDYDGEFLLHDNDFGSDAGSDNEGLAAQQIRSIKGEERIGITYIAKDSNSSGVVAYRCNNGVISMIDHCEKERDVIRLSSYPCVIFSSALPAVGDVNIASTKSSTKKKANADPAATGAVDSENAAAASAAAKTPKATIDDAVLAQLVEHIHGKKDGVDKLVESFHALNPTLVKAQLKKRILDIAERRQHSDGYGSKRWMVKEDILATHQAVTASSVVFTPLKEKKRKSVDNTSTFKTPGTKRQRAISSGVTTGNSSDTADMTVISDTSAVVDTPLIESPDSVEKNNESVDIIVQDSTAPVSSGTLLSYLRSPAKPEQATD